MPVTHAEELIASANRLYAYARSDRPSPAVAVKLIRAADLMVAAADAIHEIEAGPPPKVGGYDRDRCICCGRVLMLHAASCPRYSPGEAAHMVRARKRQRAWDLALAGYGNGVVAATNGEINGYI